MGNPVNYIDPEGSDALKIVDEENRIITVTATYYVVTLDRYYMEDGVLNCVPGYKASDVSDMEAYNDYLNGLNLTVTEGQYEGYSIKFNLSFEPSESQGSADSKMRAAITEEGYSYGNTIHRGNSILDRNCNFQEVANPDGSTSAVGAVTLDKHYIVMHNDYDTKMNSIHEIFHTFGLSHPEGGASSGVLHYPPLDPNSIDAYNLSITPFMHTIIKR